MKTYKSLIMSALAWMCIVPMQAQTVDKEAMYIYLNDGDASIFFRNEVEAVSVEARDGELVQVVKTADGEYVYPVVTIQSVSFVFPEEDTYKPEGDIDDDDEEARPTFGTAIDLGLPSGTKWASFNVGGHWPQDYGGYYAWGETEEKDYYDWRTYIHCDGSYSTCHDLGSDISGTKYDVATAKWGTHWRMPSHEQQVELIDNCHYKWTTYRGVRGGLFTSKANGKSIFLPAAGYRYGGDLISAGSYGYYWSSAQGPDRSDYACGLGFSSGRAYWSIYYRLYGRSVRPVR